MSFLKRLPNRSSLVKIKQLVNNQTKFSFKPVNLHTIKKIVEGIPSSTATAF